MKTTAYICDLCDNLVPEEEAFGITPREDMFDRLQSWPTEPFPERCEIHYCINCYREKVLVPASHQVDRKVNESGYKLKLEELAFGMRDSIVKRVIAAKRKLK